MQNGPNNKCYPGPCQFSIRFESELFGSRTRCRDVRWKRNYVENVIIWKLLWCIIIGAFVRSCERARASVRSQHVYIVCWASYIWMTMRDPNKSDRFRKRNYEWKLDGFYHIFFFLSGHDWRGRCDKMDLYTFFLFLLINANWIRNEIECSISGRNFFPQHISIVVWTRWNEEFFREIF